MTVQPVDGYSAGSMMDRSMRVTCLASGSSGNSVLIEYDERTLLVDAGIAGPKLLGHLAERGIQPGMLDGILTTHEHSDHVRGLDVVSSRMRSPVIANSPTLEAVTSELSIADTRRFRTGEMFAVGPFEVYAFPVSHDAVEPVGYWIRCGDARVSILTDLGCVTGCLYEPIRNSDLVIVEANHDVVRLQDGRYPVFLKRRILSDKGHLSNHQAAELIAETLCRREQTYWLAHLSKHNNSKHLAAASVMSYLAAGGLNPKVLVTDRDKPSLVWEPTRSAVQLGLFGYFEDDDPSRAAAKAG